MLAEALSVHYRRRRTCGLRWCWSRRRSACCTPRHRTCASTPSTWSCRGCATTRAASSSSACAHTGAAPLTESHDPGHHAGHSMATILKSFVSPHWTLRQSPDLTLFRAKTLIKRLNGTAQSSLYAPTLHCARVMAFDAAIQPPAPPRGKHNWEERRLEANPRAR